MRHKMLKKSPFNPFSASAVARKNEKLLKIVSVDKFCEFTQPYDFK